MYKYRRLIISLIAGILILSLMIGFVAMIANAAKSDEIQDELDELEEEAESLAAERELLGEEIEKTNDEMLDIANQKAQVDQEIELLKQESENVNEQIHQYNLLISEKQTALNEIQTEQETLLGNYKTRIRAIQEHGEISYLSALLNAESFADMLLYRVMIDEISKADEQMMADLREKAIDVLTAKEELDNQRGLLEDKMRELSENEELLAEKRAESDALLADLYILCAELLEDDEKYEALEAELSEEIAQKEVEYQKAKQEEYEAYLAQQQQQQQQQQNNNNSSNGDGGSSSAPTDVYFMYPLSYYGVVTSSYGYRVHPITGNYSFHNGVDLAVGQGTPIYASRSGYVSTAEYNYAYGYYVTINHMDGFSSLYGHMTHYVVSSGEYVSQGQVIGYVGSTGYSTGPHLHFTIYCNGSTVNPMNYIG
ncbi:MAG: hypothetical protein E7434_00405 [Ruminococcaceae bacterium]|nr:hypothetical protein [Oscillospiraceae bacterium]